MNWIHRNARIGYVWGGLAMLCLLLLMVAREQERAVLAERADAAEHRALLYGDTVLNQALDARDVSTPLAGASFRNLQAVVRDRVFVDPLVARVRLWSPDGTLLFSTAANERGKIGRLRVNEDPAITAAAGGAVSSRLATVPIAPSSAGDTGPPTDLLETFVPLRVSDRADVLGAVQIDQYYDTVRSAAVPWRAVQWACAGLAVVFGALTLLSFRRRSVGTVAAPVAAGAAAAPVSARTEESGRRSGEPEEAVAALRTEHEETVAALRTEHEETVAALRAELAAASSAAAAETELLGETERRVAEAEDRASEAERRASDLEVMLEDARRDTRKAAHEAPSTSAEPASLEAQALELLEARVIAAEDRAADAERRLAELGFEGPPLGSNGHRASASNGHRALSAGADAPADDRPAELEASQGDHEDLDDPDGSPVFPISPEASDLRARLARSAALKKRSIEG